MAHGRLDSLQVLRGFAATAVVLNHVFPGSTSIVPAGALIISPRIAALGSAGADLFFILSGFLMIYIAPPYFARERGIGNFIAQRLIRIWPPYTLATLAACVPLAMQAIRSGGLPFDLRPIRLTGILFVPSFNAYGRVNPILIVGWTLDYEILFYACFAVVLLGSPRWALAKLAIMLTALLALGLLLGGTAMGEFLGKTVVAEFLMGAVIARIWLAGRLPRECGIIMLGVGLVLLLGNAVYPEMKVGGWRPLVYGIPMALVFLAFLALEHVR